MVFLTHAGPSPDVLERNHEMVPRDGTTRCAIKCCNNFRGLGGEQLFPGRGGDIAKKELPSLTYTGPSPDLLERNQWHHKIRHQILQELLGVRGE